MTDPMVFPNFVASFLGHFDGQEILGHKVVTSLILTTIDPASGEVILHGRNMQKRDANGMRNQRTRFSLYGHDYWTAESIAEVIHSSLLDDGVTIEPNIMNPELAFFDHIESEQAPFLQESPGLTSIVFVFDLVAVSRSIN
ncbi:hypothetical protein [Auritidibacter ignavus]|uniref:Uncharacterized protein n=1 Tax=Auritidibacter ignavus TaxID=678932 RepID=A0AAJ6APZ9_9MICC|nr:hypothetical protein [Auritidibacter ignavus]NIH72217.1 hypothetical protein [Auritidibacter ignavus]RMX23766.1 hypothetical protein DYI20_02820 [Auritidibacter ignavus]WGH82524.1 hypothetical protein QDX25_05065 [Auritidibacter ignavus]WGH87090.1 hypothetical protein QDX24_04645 [Auritidibacter ignavus]WGH89374.1 hypothetical protein QDX22_04640 [Auritidibacter ignavus]